VAKRGWNDFTYLNTSCELTQAQQRQKTPEEEQMSKTVAL
jgi:hypothetical protein